jgi:D-3-phosphoglycerate dehydrogenase
VDNIDLEAATGLGICVVHQPTYCVNEVATQALALLLDCVRRVTQIDRMVRDGYWGPCSLPIRRMNGRTLGLIGFGRIARNLARKMRGFQVEIIAFDPYLPQAEFDRHGVRQADLKSLLREADYVSVHCPLNPETLHLLGSDEFGMMKDGAVLINVGRGAIIDEKALIRALETGKPAAAGLDVLESEPPQPGNPLLTMPNVVLTHHTGGYSLEARIEKSETLIRDLDLVFSGKWPSNLANPKLKEAGGPPRFLRGV